MANGSLNRKLRMGLVGGGIGSFIGKVHSIAACLDNRATVVAGAFSSDPKRSKDSASDYDVPAQRAYGSYEEMMKSEAGRSEGDRVDFVSVTTPNHTHAAIATAALEAGFHVVCDKPMTFDLPQAEQLAATVKKTGKVFALTHTYTGYPLVRQARAMIAAGELGEIQAIRSNYIQGWLRSKLEDADQKQAAWRTDPKKSGAAGAFGDIATHAYNMARYMTGLRPAEISCHLKSFVPGRVLDDYGTAVVRFENGALGTVTASQISHGRENDMYIEVDGTEGSLQWRQENPNELIVRRNGKPHQVYTRDPGGGYLHGVAAASCRLPSGHPEGYFEAFANVYTAAFEDMIAAADGKFTQKKDTLYTNVFDGVEGMLFIQQCVASSRENGSWMPMKHESIR